MLTIALASLFIVAYIGAGFIAVKVVTEGPAFETSTQLDLRHGCVHLFKAKPATIVWETPEEIEAVNFLISTAVRVPVPLGYKVESIL